MSAVLESAEVDLSACAEEPIHVPGAIQPHGVLLALDDEGHVRVVSESLHEHLAVEPDAALGAPLEAVVGPAAAELLQRALDRPDPEAANPLRLEVAGRAWDGIVHRTPEGGIVELEPAAGGDPRSVVGLYGRVRTWLGRLQAADEPGALQERVADAVAELTGMDRVMVYRFDGEWNGEVVAERGAEGLDSYLGLRFPSTDIPSQARELYRRNWIRLIARVDYRPSRLVPARDPVTGRPLDLSGATLRSVSPVHLEYLRNMGVSASMSISLLERGRLWGLIACHHRTPKTVPYAVRTACEFLGQTFSVQIAGLGQEREQERALDLERKAARLTERAAGRQDWASALTLESPRLEDIVGAAGAALRYRGRTLTCGRTPPVEAVEEIVGWLGERGERRVVTRELARHLPAARAWAARASGLLALRLGALDAPGSGGGDWLLWFLPEEVEEVRWAGNPGKAATVGERPPAGADEHAGTVPALHPRKSFEAWSETVRGRSRPWAPAEEQVADSFRARLVDVILRQVDQLAALNERLRRSNEELDAFTHIAGHDLQEPLRGIRAYASMIRDMAPELDAEGSPVREIERLGERMATMLESLLRYSRAQHLELDLRPVDLQELLDEVLDTLRLRIGEHGTEVRIPRPLPTLPCDRVRVGAVFQNLLTNAVKYNESEDPWVEIGWERDEEGVVVLRVADNGIGIEPRHREVVFDLFRRLHPQSRYGGGAGAGLPIARRLVERHGGRLWLESEPGRGTTFYFTLE